MRHLSILAAFSGLVFAAQPMVPPEILRRVEPEYTAEARARRVEGVVSIRVVVNAEGVPENGKVVRSLSADLDECALRAVQQWRFRPATRDGIPVAISATVDVQFRLPRYPVFPSSSGRPKEAPPVETHDRAIEWWDVIQLATDDLWDGGALRKQ